MVRRAGVRVRPAGAAAQHRHPVFRGLPLLAEPVPGPPRRARPVAGAGVSRGLQPSGPAQPVPLALLGPAAADGVLERHGHCRHAHRRAAAARAAVGSAHRVPGPVAAVHVDRERGADVLRLRLGDAAAGGRVHGGLPRLRPDSPAPDHPDPAGLAGVPAGVRRRPDQDPRRPGMAGPDRPVLPPRDPADAGAAEPAGPPAPQGLAPGGGPGQPLRPAGGALLPLRPAAPGQRRRRDHRLHPAVAGGERQFRLAELDGDHPGLRGGQRSRGARRDSGDPAGLACRVRARRRRSSGRQPGAGSVARGGRGRHCAAGGAQLPAASRTCSPTAS